MEWISSVGEQIKSISSTALENIDNAVSAAAQEYVPPNASDTDSNAGDEQKLTNGADLDAINIEGEGPDGFRRFVDKQNHEIRSLREQLTHLAEENEGLRMTVDQTSPLKSMLRHKDVELERYRGMVHDQDTTVNDLNTQSISLQEKIVELEEEIQRLKALSDPSNLVSINLNVSSGLESRGTSTCDLGEAGDVEELARKNAQLEDELRSLKLQVSAPLEPIEVALDKSEEISNLRSQLTRLEKEHADSFSEKDDLEKMVAGLRIALDKTKSDHEVEVEHMSEQLQKADDFYEEQRAILEKDIDSQKETMTGQDRLIDAVNSQMMELRRQLDTNRVQTQHQFDEKHAEYELELSQLRHLVTSQQSVTEELHSQLSVADMPRDEEGVPIGPVKIVLNVGEEFSSTGSPSTPDDSSLAALLEKAILRVETLRNYKDFLEDQLHQTVDEKDRRTDEVVKLHEENIELKIGKEESERQNEEFRDEFQDFELSAEEMRATIHEERRSNFSKDEEIRKLNVQLEEIKESERDLLAEVDLLSGKSTETNLHETETSLRETETSLRETETNLLEAEGDNEFLSGRLQECMAQRTSMEQRFVAFQKASSSEIDKLKIENDELKKVASEIGDMDAVRIELQRQKDELAVRLANVADQKDELAGRLANVAGRLRQTIWEELGREVDASATLAHLTSLVADQLSSLRKSEKGYNQKLRDSNSNIENLQRAKEAAEQSYRAHLDTLEEDLRQLQTSSQLELEQSRELLQEKQSNLSDLARQLAESSSKLEDQTALNFRLREGTQEEAGSQQSSSAAAEIAALTEQLKEAHIQSEAAARTHERGCAQVDEYAAQIEQLSATLGLMDSERRALKGAATEAGGRVRELTDKCAAVEASCAEVERERAELRQKNESISSRLGESTNREADLTSQLSQITTERDELRSICDKLRSTSDRLQSSLSEQPGRAETDSPSRAEFEEMREKAVTAMKQYKSLLDRFSTLQAELRNAHTRHEELEQSVEISKQESLQIKRILDKTESNLAKERVTGQQFLQEEQEQNDQLQGEIVGLRATIDTLHRQMRDNEKSKLLSESVRNESTESCQRDLSSARQETDKLRFQLNEAASEHRAARADYEEQIQKLRQRLAQHELNEEDHELVRKDYAALKAEFEEKLVEFNAVSAALERCERALAQSQNEQKEEAKRLRAQLEAERRCGSSSDPGPSGGPVTDANAPARVSVSRADLEDRMARKTTELRDLRTVFHQAQKYTLKLKTENASIRRTLNNTLRQLKTFNSDDNQVDRRLVNKLLCTYFEGRSGSSCPAEVLELMSRILRFSEAEQRLMAVGKFRRRSSQQGGGWGLSSWIPSFAEESAAPPPTRKRSNSNALTDLWVEFLLQEATDGDADLLVNPEVTGSTVSSLASDAGYASDSTGSGFRDDMSVSSSMGGREHAVGSSTASANVTHSSTASANAPRSSTASVNASHSSTASANAPRSSTASANRPLTSSPSVPVGRADGNSNGEIAEHLIASGTGLALYSSESPLVSQNISSENSTQDEFRERT
eukprot:252820_1